jgi:NitT/TauT family transport system ATP-binding protein
MSIFVLHDVAKAFTSREGAVVPALDGLSFEAASSSGITCIVGPTGSGKSTVLRIVAGLEKADRGSVTVNGQDPVNAVGLVGYLTQRHTLFPWMNVRDNVGLPLSLRSLPAADVHRRVSAICSQLGLEGAEERYPYELSGGMQQRAALGRLMASEARLWLLDEPFTALDERTRHQLQHLVITLVRERRLALLFVTHSIDEAVFLADRVVVLSAGPGRMVDTVDIGLGHPRDRLSPAYGGLMERIRTRIESVL